MAFFGQELFIKADKCGPLPDPHYTEVRPVVVVVVVAAEATDTAAAVADGVVL